MYFFVCFSASFLLFFGGWFLFLFNFFGKFVRVVKLHVCRFFSGFWVEPQDDRQIYLDLNKIDFNLFGIITLSNQNHRESKKNIKEKIPLRINTWKRKHPLQNNNTKDNNVNVHKTIKKLKFMSYFVKEN